MDKKELRKIVTQQRNNLTSNQVETFSNLIAEKLKNLQAIKDSRFIFSYMPYGNEVNILPLNRWILKQSKDLCIPRVINNSFMDAVKIDNFQDGLIKGHYGILEPIPSLKPVNIDKIDLVLVPGLAFDMQGNRLGHGMGYYDRFLTKCKENTFTIGVAYDFQIFKSIPHAIHDVKLDAIITEKNYYTF